MKKRKFGKAFSCVALALCVVVSSASAYTTTAVAATEATEITTQTKSSDNYPDNVKQTAQTANSITVSWTAAQNTDYTKRNYGTLTGYNVYYMPYSASDYVYAGTTADTSYTVAGLAAGSKYNIKVEAVYSLKVGGSKTAYDAETLIDANATVTNLTEERWYHFIESCDVTWDTFETADGYEVQFYNNKNKLVDSTTTTYGSYSNGNVKNEIIYTIKVRAYQTALDGSTVYTQWAEAKVFDQPFIKKASFKKNKIKVSWPKQNGAAKYEVYLSTSGKAGTFKKVATTKKTSATIKKYCGKKLKKKTYYILVKSVASNGSNSGEVYCWKIKKGKTVKTASFMWI